MLGDKSEELEPGGIVGFYRLSRQMGRGGMGAVYEATDTRTGEKVALKFMRTGVVRNETERKRFEREMTVPTMLDHPGIVKVMEFGEHAGEPYYVMEHIEGWSLSTVPREVLFGFAGPPPDDAPTKEAAQPRPVSTRDKTRPSMGKDYFAFVAKLGVQAAEALEYAHQQGVIHRDIKPSNLMLTPEGRVKMLDFGLAKAVGLEKLTTTGDFFGTPAYMSPEQAAGEVSRVDHRTDVYSLGTTLYQLLTFSTPFAGETRVVTSAIIHRQPVEPRKLNRLIPGSMNAIVLKAMEKRKEDRYSTAEELAEDLQKYLVGKKVGARQGSLRWKIARALRKRRREVLLVLSSLLALSLVVGVIRGCHIWKKQRYNELIASGNSFLDGGKYEKAISYFGDALEAEKDSAEARLKLWDAKVRLEKLLPGSAEKHVLALSFSPSGDLLAAGFRDRSVRIWHVNALSEEPQEFPGHGSDVTALCFAQNESLFASGDASGTVKVWKVSKGKETFSLEEAASVSVCNSPISTLAFVDNDGQLFVADDRGRTTVCDPWAAAGHQVSDYVGNKDLEGSVIRGNRAGGFFVTLRWQQPGSDERLVEVYDIASYECSLRASVRAEGFSAYAASEAGDALAIGYKDGRIALFGQDDDSPPDLKTKNVGLPIVKLSFFDGGRKLLSCSSSGSLAVWDVARREPEVTVANRCGGVNAMAVTSRRGLVALAPATGGIQVWKTDVDQALHAEKVISLSSDVTGVPPPPAVGVAFSAKGEFLAVGDETGGITVWKTATGELMQSFNRHGKGHYSLTVVGETEDQSQAPVQASPRKLGVEEPDLMSLEVTATPFDIGWHRFTVTSPGTYAIETHQVAGKAAIDTLLGLYDVKDVKRTIAYDNDGGEGHLSKIVEDLDPGNYIVKVTKFPSAVHALAFSPRQEELLAFSIADREGAIGTLNVRTGRAQRSRHGGGTTFSLCFHEDGRLLASGDNRSGVTLWDPITLAKRETHRLVRTGHRIVKPVRFAVKDSDMLVALTSDGRAWRWRTRKSERPESYPGPGITSTCTAIGPRGRLAAIVSEKEQVVALCDLRGRKPEILFEAREGVQNEINRLVFSRDGQIIASVGNDVTVKLWDVKHKRDILTLTTEPERTLSLALDRSASRMAVGLANGKVLLYNF